MLYFKKLTGYFSVFFILCTIPLLAIGKMPHYQYNVKFQNEVYHFFAQLNPDFLFNKLIQFTNFPDRSAETANGMAAANWINQQVNLLIKTSKRDDVTSYIIKTKQFSKNNQQQPINQPSIVLKIGNTDSAGIVVGAHYDTYPKYDIEKSREYCKIIKDPQKQKSCIEDLSANKPGADDDGSGSAALLEIARILLKSSIHFKNPIYLIWYADEEDGLLGSKSVVEHFQKNKIAISSVMQLDQIGFAFQNDPTMWLTTNFTDKNLTAFVASLIQVYLHRPVAHTASKGPASDNYSWYEKNIPTAFPFEAEMKLGKGNLAVHTRYDTIDKLSLTHLLDYTKLAIAFIVELAKPSTSTSAQNF